MAEFMSASMRAAGSDLTIAISPLGLIELSDEEFEVHGPRLTRYAQNWAFYLGHHWAYRRQVGEPQLVFNWTAAFSNYLTNFTFTKPVQFMSDKRVAHIVPALIDRILSKDNKKEQLFWEMGNLGSVSGDAFAKIAYEPPWFMTKDNQIHEGYPTEAQRRALKVAHRGKVRILALNPAFCFPEWAPHDQNRLLRFKLKYRFWATSPEGTRQVYTYTEILQDDIIQEYVNDQLIDQRDNPLGEIPIVHIANKPAASSPWGLADIQDIIGLNREYNEKATEISDILNYHVAPVTIITGAKTNNIERGANKVWGILNDAAKVYNLPTGTEGVPPALEYLIALEDKMSKVMGVPQSCLGEQQAVSNTSGVALTIQYFPVMLQYALKCQQYGYGWKQIMYYALRTLFLEEPETLLWDPDTDGLWEDKDVQPPEVDPFDPVTYDMDVIWPPPLPVDQLVILNELLLKMQLGIESKRGALEELGEQFPDEKLLELFEEIIREAKMDGAKEILQANIHAAIMTLTGVVPEGVTPVDQGEGSTTTTTNAKTGSKSVKKTMPVKPPVSALGGLGDIGKLIGSAGGEMISELTTMAYGTKLPQARSMESGNSNKKVQ